MEQVVLHREGGLGLTKRWSAGQLPIVAEEDWLEEESQTIGFTTGFVVPLRANVRKIAEREGDVTGRFFTSVSGETQWMAVPLYALTNPAQFQTTFHDHIVTYAKDWASQMGESHREALRLIRLGQVQPLEKLICYDFGRWYKTGSAWIKGENKLGIPQLPEDAQTMPGQAPLPRPITAQVDIINSMALHAWLNELLGQGGAFTALLEASPIAKEVHVAYVALRILTEGSIWIFQDMMRRKRQYSAQELPPTIFPVQRGLNTVIRHVAQAVQRHESTYDIILGDFSPEERAYHERVALEPVPEPDEELWANPLYWLPPLEELCETAWSDRVPFSETAK